MEYHSGGSLPLLGRPRYCPGANTNGGYLCETGHCCGETGCCTYYYELWWFWMLWTILILFSCCCAYRHRRAKLRVQQQQRQREISLLAYHGASSYPSSMLDLSFLASLKLPSYEEVAAQPSTPPPPYSSVFTTPRYPQPPCTVDPHLLTQHGPLLHRPLSDGPSSISSDNSSSCSCDSCCPSSPCSSTISAPVTYETDTSHASTPSEATPLTFEVTVENISAAASCLEVSETRFASERMVATVTDITNEANAARAQEPVTKDSSVPNQTVTVAVVTRAASPQPSPSPSLEVAPPVGTTYPSKQHLDQTPCNTVVSICSLSVLPGQRVADTALPSIQKINPEVPAESLETTAAPKTTLMSSLPISTDGAADRPEINLTVEPLNSRTFNSTNDPGFRNLEPSPDVGRTLALITDCAGPPVLDSFPSLVPIPAHLNFSHASTPVPPNLTQVLVPVPPNLTQSSNPVPANHDGDAVPTIFTQSPEPVLPNYTPQTTSAHVLDSTPTLSNAHSNFNLTIATTPTSSILACCQNAETLLGASLTLVPSSPVSDLPQHTSGLDLIAVPPESGPCLVLSQLSDSGIVGSLPSDLEDGHRSGLCSGSGSRSGSPSAPTPVPTFPTPTSSSSCPAITIESEASFVAIQSSPSALSPSISPSTPSPPAPASTSLTAPALLLDPLTAVHQSSKGGASSGHASSLSPSPRATQSPPKQTLFSPCVDVIEPGPPNWEDGEGEQEADMDDYDDDDMGADESQYRHRRLTGDSGIEVCRCRVKKEDDEEEEEGGEGKQREKKGGGNTDLHDSVDCPSRGQLTTPEGLTLCNSTSTTTPTSEDSGEVVIVMETV